MNNFDSLLDLSALDSISVKGEGKIRPDTRMEIMVTQITNEDSPLEKTELALDLSDVPPGEYELEVSFGDRQVEAKSND